MVSLGILLKYSLAQQGGWGRRVSVFLASSLGGAAPGVAKLTL